MRLPRSPKQRPDRPIELLSRVVAGDPSAWHRFVEGYAGFLFSLAWPYARADVDLASELVLVALEGLHRTDAQGAPFYRLRKYLDTLEQFGRRSKFVTWLALVVKNLFRDWFREQAGRRWLPKEIEDQAPQARALYKALFWDGLSQTEAFEALVAAWPELQLGEFDVLLDQVMRALDQRNLYKLYQDLLRRLPALLIDDAGQTRDRQTVQLADPNPSSRPDLALEIKDQEKAASLVHRQLERAIKGLPEATRRVVQLLALRGLSGQQVQRIMGFRNRQRVYDEMAKARRRIRVALDKAGVTAAQAQQAIGWLDGLEFEEIDRSGTRSPTRLRRGRVDPNDTPNQEV